jgi:ferric-dicitrate binding protein FerR (iron transport regulator)
MTPDAEDALTREEIGVHGADATWRDERRLAVAIGAALRADQGAATARTVLTLIHRSRGSAPQRLVHRSLTARRRLRHPSSIWHWAAAALLALCVGGGTWWAMQPPTLAFFNGGRALVAGGTVNGPCDIAFHDGTRVVIDAGTRLTLLSAQDRRGSGPGKRLRMEIGSLTATVARQPIDAAFVITTPQGDVCVVGTKFTLSADAMVSRLDVQDGHVRFSNVAGSINVESGASATLTRDEQPRLLAIIADSTILPTPLMTWKVDGTQLGGSWEHGALTTIDGQACVEGRLGFTNAPECSMVRWLAVKGQAWPVVPEAVLQFDVFVPATVHEIHVQLHHHAGSNWGETLPVQGGRWQTCRIRLDQLLHFSPDPSRPLTADDKLDDLTLYTSPKVAGPCRFRNLRLNPPDHESKGELE